MPNKSFSIYGSDETTAENSARVVIEIATCHLACVVSHEREHKRGIAGYELFTFDEEEAGNFSKLFETVSSDSKILSKDLSSVDIYFNRPECLPVPIFKFNKEIAADYLDVVFGEDGSSKIQFEHLAVEPGIMNVFRVDNDRYDFFSQQFRKPVWHHTYSNIIRRIAFKSFVYPSEFISVQFYSTSMIVLVLREGNFHLIQSFSYENPEDVLFHLLNISNQLELFSEKLTVQISGVIDLEFQLYRELIKYFKNVIVQNMKPSALFLDTKEHPPHFFTPFFNLAL